jgi:hypothetical protein
MERFDELDCAPRPKCLQWPNCYKVVVDEVVVCSGIYYAMLASLPTPEDYIIIETPIDDDE